MSSPYSTMRWRSNGRQLKVWSHVAKESLSINAIGRPITSIINLEFPSPTKWESCKYKTYKKSLPRLRFPIRDYSPRWPQDSWIFIGQALLVVVIVNPSCGASWTIIGLIIYHSMQQYFLLSLGIRGGMAEQPQADKTSLPNPFIYVQFPILFQLATEICLIDPPRISYPPRKSFRKLLARHPVNPIEKTATRSYCSQAIQSRKQLNRVF